MGGECLLQRENKDLLLQIINNRAGPSKSLSVGNSFGVVRVRVLCFVFTISGVYRSMIAVVSVSGVLVLLCGAKILETYTSSLSS